MEAGLAALPVLARFARIGVRAGAAILTVGV